MLFEKLKDRHFVLMSSDVIRRPLMSLQNWNCCFSVNGWHSGRLKNAVEWLWWLRRFQKTGKHLIIDFVREGTSHNSLHHIFVFDVTIDVLSYIAEGEDVVTLLLGDSLSQHFKYVPDFSG